MSTAQTSENWYLVSFGNNGIIGYFASADLDCDYERGTEVLIQTDRGEEKGIVLRRAVLKEDRVQLSPSTSGRILCRFCPALGNHQITDRLEQYFEEARKIIQSLFLPVQVVDIEQLLQPPTIVLHIVQFGPFDDATLLAEFKRRWNVPVQLMNLTDQDSLADEQQGSCGSGCSNCGSGSCGSEGCGQGSCQSHSTSQEPFQQTWQNYLAERRSQVVTGSSQH